MIEFIKTHDYYKCDCQGLYFKFVESFNLPVSGEITLECVEKEYKYRYSVVLLWGDEYCILELFNSIDECREYMQDVVDNLNKQIKEQLQKLYDVESKEAFEKLTID